MNYPQLQTLSEKYKTRGLEILAFPCNQFGRQEPGNDADIKTWALSTYHVTFHMFSKIKVTRVNR